MRNRRNHDLARGVRRAALPLLVAAGALLASAGAAEAKEKPNQPGTPVESGDSRRTESFRTSGETPTDPTREPEDAEDQTEPELWAYDDSFWTIAAWCSVNVVKYVVLGACIQGSGNAVSSDPASTAVVKGSAWGATAVTVTVPQNERPGEPCTIYAANMIDMSTAYSLLGNGTNGLFARSDARDLKGGLHTMRVLASTSVTQSGSTTTSGSATVSYSGTNTTQSDRKTTGTGASSRNGASSTESLTVNATTSETNEYAWTAGANVVGTATNSAVVNDAKAGRTATWSAASWEESKLTACSLAVGVPTRVDLYEQDTVNVLYTSYVLGDSTGTGGGGGDGGGGGTPPGEGSGGDTTGGGAPPGGSGSGSTTPGGTEVPEGAGSGGDEPQEPEDPNAPEQPQEPERPEEPEQPAGSGVPEPDPVGPGGTP
ncbi:MAG: hypothetical protein HMLKMBBP_01924 [Planctomycetes bacterium]|nr:hypothetical protein [Planctomycetota bacterium]